MSRVKIVTHCLIRNEERFIWYALQSALPYVDQIMVWDTGSTDHTVEIVKSIKSPKIKFRQLKEVTPETFTLTSQEMIEATPNWATWILVLDGDEIWPETAIKKVVAFARKHPEYESIVVRSNNLVGDIYHRLPASAGQYRLAGQKGHLALRLMNRKTIKGLHFAKPHGQRSLFDADDRLIQDRDPAKIKFIDVSYHHATHLTRSSADDQTMKRLFKRKYELGEKIPSAQVPQIFFQPHPDFVPDVTAKAPLSVWFKAAILTPARRLKRLLLPPKSGY